MDGVHDMGGMHGFGPIDVTDDESIHEDWEWMIFALDRILKIEGRYNIDEKRHAIERLDPAVYLNSSYFERWVNAIETLVIEHGIISRTELDTRAKQIRNGAHDPENADLQSRGAIADRVRESLYSVSSFRRDAKQATFEDGQPVRVRNSHPSGHTRSPRYARRTTGVIQSHHGTFVLPDSNAHGEETAEPLYSVRFTARGLWGEDHSGHDTVCIDLWERYLEPVQPRSDHP